MWPFFDGRSSEDQRVDTSIADTIGIGTGDPGSGMFGVPRFTQGRTPASNALTIWLVILHRNRFS